MRVSELAKELGLTSKEVIEKLAQIQIVVKTHSSAVTPDQISRLKASLNTKPAAEVKKPKAFIVKKAKPEAKPEVTVVEKEIPKEPEKETTEQTKTSVETVQKIERPKIEVVKKQPVNRLEIVRRQEKQPEQKQISANKPQKGSERPAATRPIRQTERPIERHIIPQDIYENKGSSSKHKQADKRKDKISKEEEQERISLEKAAAQKHRKRSHKEEEKEAVTQLVVNTAMTISELADKINKTPAEIVKFLMLNGIMATVNQLIDVDVIKKVCAEYELEVLDEDLDAYVEQEMAKEEKKEKLKADEKNMVSRAPVISIMGHVDHGKTTLLDSIRASKHKIVNTEVGGITQSIGAYTIYLNNNKKVVFLDTPGHEAFTEMRARGAKATDIAILVVAADDGIMPQTIEAINHAKAAEIPIIVAVNKIDKAGADPDRILTQLTEHGLVPEAWGGDTITCQVSALQRQGIDELLEYILLVADMQDLKANPNASASGVVIEANLDKGKGPVATLLVQNGTLKVGNCVVVGTA